MIVPEISSDRGTTGKKQGQRLRESDSMHLAPALLTYRIQ